MNTNQSKVKAIDAAEKQSLLAVLQFLKKKNLKVKFYLIVLYSYTNMIMQLTINSSNIYEP